VTHPTIHSRYTVWTLVVSGLVVVAATTRVLADAPTALLVTVVGATAALAFATRRHVDGLEYTATNDADVTEGG
jgi:hypothetical protein